MIEVEDKYMARCIALARGGLGYTSPNPMVGAVVVYNGKIIGEGFHRKCGGPHAEVNAIASVKHESMLKDSTLYVSLVPIMAKRLRVRNLSLKSRFHVLLLVASILFLKFQVVEYVCCVTPVWKLLPVCWKKKLMS